MSVNQQLPTVFDAVIDSGFDARTTRLSNGISQRERRPRVALITPYDGGNLGDAVIQDAMIANISVRLPSALISGISLNCDNFKQRHGHDAFALCSGNRPFYSLSREEVSVHSIKTKIKKIVKRLPILGWLAKSLYKLTTWLWGELRHWVGACRFLLDQDLVIVSGGGQLDEEWGGPWGHPFALFKWAILARMLKVPFTFASVGACKVTSTTSRFFLSMALRMARYRSYRDKHSRQIAAGLLKQTAKDPIVPDLAFSMPSSELSTHRNIRSKTQGRKIVAISPIIYAKPENWPFADQNIYQRYVCEMGRIVSHLLRNNYFVDIIWSSSDDKAVIPEILEHLDYQSAKFASSLSIASITSWKDIVSALVDVDFLVASRLHSAILGFLTQKPVIAISFDPKVDWLMQDFRQCDYLLHIHNFTAEDVIKALCRLEVRDRIVVGQIASYRSEIASAFEPQYRILAECAMRCYKRRHSVQ